MQQPESKTAITRDKYDAVLFDLDGVITDTANIHATCWKKMFEPVSSNGTRNAREAVLPSVQRTIALHVPPWPLAGRPCHTPR